LKIKIFKPEQKLSPYARCKTPRLSLLCLCTCKQKLW